MLFPDPRGYRVALVADSIVNEAAATYDVVGALEAADFGMIVPPPSEFALQTIASTMEYIVDDLVDYAKQGYRVVTIGASSLPQSGLWSDVVDAELTRRGLPPFESFDVDRLDANDLVAFLTSVTPAAIG